MVKNTIISALAGTAVGVVSWLLTRNLWCLVPAIVALIAVFWILDKVAPPKDDGLDTANVKTGIAADEVLAEIQKQSQQLAVYTKVIISSDVSTELQKIQTTLAGVATFVENNPNEADKARRLVKYYMPTLLSLLDFCQEYGQKDAQWLAKFVDNLRQTEAALSNLASQLYSRQKMTTEVEMDVMLKMMQQDGHLQGMNTLK